MQPKEIRSKWEPHIGKFVLSFTAIEHFVTISIDVLSHKSVSETARSLLFEKRTKLLIELIENSITISKECKSILINQLQSSLSLSRNARNIIAHNHILTEFYTNSDDGNLYEREQIFSSRNRNKKISLPELIAFALDAEKLAEDMGDTYLRLLKEHFSSSNSAQQLLARRPGASAVF